ncbi:hypothetical protein Leryth_023399 [Lithospermum erythrorhizon]|nr:hypothetical protein Leryth_023399 [Lithospermum erythrorhizon]
MVQSLKLGLCHLSTLKVICEPPEIGALSFGKFRAMSNKQSSSPPLNGNAVKGSSNGNGNLGDDAKNIENMTVQQLRSKLRDVGVPAKGSKDELISALRRFLNLNNGECTTLLEEVEMENVGKRSSKRISSKDHLLNELNIEAYGTKRGKRASETSGEQLTASSKTYRKEEISVESLQMEDARDNEVQLKVSVKAKRKVRLKNDSLNDGTTDIVDSSVSQSEPWTVFAHKKPQDGWIAYNPRSMRRPPLNENTNHLKLVSWNVNGLRALLKLDTFHALAQREKFDVLCLQETKLQVGFLHNFLK